jgi:riboflavin kinase / FMN adenylyltransferase
VIEISAQLIEHAAVSSTRIRKAIAAGNVADAGAMLGRPCSLEGSVVHGNKLGRTLGYPTANIRLTDPDQIIPCTGIYSVKVMVGSVLYGGMMSIGYNPTVTNSTEIKLEVNIFDFDRDIYHQSLEVFFIEFLRSEQKFNSLDELTIQLHNDKIAAIASLS